jgi:hypothetical protein
MHPKLERYAARAFSFLHGHWVIAESRFEFAHPDDASLIISGRAIGFDGSPLYIHEAMEMEQEMLVKVDYSYQFRNEGDQGFFRYDDASHGRPDPYHHKHEYQKPIQSTTTPPTLFEFLREVEDTLTKGF